jgi:hypothetical protein
MTDASTFTPDDREQIRLGLLDAGFDPIPVKGKGPYFTGWQKLGGSNPDEIRLWTEMHWDHASTGILTARTPTLDIDILDPEAATAIEELVRERFEERGDVLTRFGRAPKRAIPFRCDQPFNKITRKFAPPHENERIEFLAFGQQIVAFGIHVGTKQPYRWFNGAPGEVTRDELPDIDAEEASTLVNDIVALLEPFGYRRATATGGNGEPLEWADCIENVIDHDVLASFAMKLLLTGMAPASVVSYLSAVVGSLKDVDPDRKQRRLDEIIAMVRSAVRKLESARAAAQPPPSAALDAPLLDPWETFIVPPFPLDVFTQGVQDFVTVQARIVGCDANGLAIAALVNFSAAIDHRFKLRMMRNSTWVVRPRLWAILCGEVAAGKTPAVNASVSELEIVQSALWRSYEIALKAYERDKEAGKDDAVEPVKPPRFLTMSITVEKVVDILSRQERAGILVKCDEIAGWIGAMEKYVGSSKGASANRAFWLKGYDGGPYFEDRIGRGEKQVADLSVSMLGTTQPKRLAEMHGLTSDGLLQRFLPMMVGAVDIAKDEPSESALGYYASLTRRLIALKPATIILSDEALAEMNRLRQRIRDLELVASSVADGFEGFVGKLHGIVGSLTLILHIIESPEAFMRDVERKTVENAGRIIDCILKHAFVFYRIAESSTEGDRIQRLASYILTSGKSRFVASDFTSNVRHLRGLSLAELNKQISVLVAGGWLIPEPKRDLAHQFQPQISNPAVPHAWNLNPEVPRKMADKAQVEQRRKAELATLWKSWATAQP